MGLTVGTDSNRTPVVYFHYAPDQRLVVVKWQYQDLSTMKGGGERPAPGAHSNPMKGGDGEASETCWGGENEGDGGDQGRDV